jgi:hypothetical protein
MIISVGYRVKSQRGIEFRIWATQVLKDYFMRGYAVNHRIERLEYRMMETEKKVDFFVKTALPPVEGIFFDGQIFDAYTFASDLVKRAKKRIILFDNYIKVYHIGASMKDLGKKLFAFSEIDINPTELLAHI